MDLPPPVAVSPFIRFCRYGFLSMGIVYGAIHQSRLSKKEKTIRAVQAKQKVTRDAELKIQKARQSEDERRAIAMLSR